MDFGVPSLRIGLAGMLFAAAVAHPETNALSPVVSQNKGQSQVDVTALEPGKPVEQEIAAKQKLSFRFELAQNQYVILLVNCHGMTGNVTPIDTTGSVMMLWDPDPSTKEMTIEVVGEQAGTYGLEIVNTLPNAPIGTCSVQLKTPRPATETDILLNQVHVLSYKVDRLIAAEKLDEAFDAAQKALALHEKAVGADDPHVALSLNTLGQISFLMGDYPKATSYFLRSREYKSAPLVIANPSFGEAETVHVANQTQPRPTLSALTFRRSITTGEDISSVYFAPLAATAQEARSIQVLFPESEVRTGDDASKAALQRADAPRILHIATHGFFLQDKASASENAGAGRKRSINATVKIENPLLRSGLALSGANLNKEARDDGILTALEASNLNLWGTKLATLSACDTGLGEVKNGEGVYGLRRSFFLAGTESLIMSLWPVSDYVTRRLMTKYYSSLKTGLGRGEALRRAQLAMLNSKNHQHPFYWASFIQAGEWANLKGHR